MARVLILVIVALIQASVGNAAGGGNTTGFSNTCVGYNAGTAITTPNSNMPVLL